VVNEHPDKARLLKFPKEVLVDYFLRRQLFEIDWRVLEQASLLYQYERITEQQGEKGISLRKWAKLDEEWQRTNKRMKSVLKRLHKLQGIGE